MKRILFYLTLFLLIPVLGLADTILLTSSGNQNEIDLKNFTPDQARTHLRYGPVSLSVMNQSIDSISLAPAQPKGVSTIPFVETIAEASVEPSHVAMQAYFKIHHELQNAWDLDQIRPVATDDYIAQMQQRVDSGANKIMVLQLMQAMRPSSTYIVDSRVEEEKAKLAVKGVAVFGDMYGVIDLVKENGEWKIHEESWMTAEPEDVKSMIAVSRVGTVHPQQPLFAQGNRDQFLAEVNRSSYSFDRNPLLLKQVGGYTRKEAFMLTFFVRKEERSRVKSGDLKAQRKQLHILWTGPKELLPQQKRFETKYPFDVSIANHKDGYLPGHVNLRLPKKRPSEFYASILVNF